jgi:mono/diheme cytochrome c family protein
MLKRALLSGISLATLLLLAGCEGTTSRVPALEVWPDMRRQDRGKPQTFSKFFSDHRSSRPPVPGTIARGQLKEDDVYFTGVVANSYIGKNPETIDAPLMKLGQMKFNTYCSPCHDRTGQGTGIVALKSNGSWIPANLHQDRIKGMNDGELFSVITQGRRSMPSYRFQTTEHDRWAIVAYVRALQRTSSGTVNDVPQELRADIR